MNSRGFTLIEILLSVAIITIMAAISLPVSRKSLASTQLRVATNAYEQCLYRAQQLARNTTQDSRWGCYLEPGRIRLFAGNSHASRNSVFDEDYEIASSLTFSGVSERTFAKVSGTPQETGTTTLGNFLGDSTVVDVNSKGTVLY